MGVESLSHWTTREVSHLNFFFSPQFLKKIFDLNSLNFLLIRAHRWVTAPSPLGKNIGGLFLENIKQKVFGLWDTSLVDGEGSLLKIQGF